MSGKDDLYTFRLPWRTFLLLTLCACSLMVHFVADGLTPMAGASGFELAAHGGCEHPAHEHGDENFVCPFQTRLPAAQAVPHLTPPPAMDAASFSISPLLPPPNC